MGWLSALFFTEPKNYDDEELQLAAFGVIYDSIGAYHATNSLSREQLAIAREKLEKFKVFVLTLEDKGEINAYNYWISAYETQIRMSEATFERIDRQKELKEKITKPDFR